MTWHGVETWTSAVVECRAQRWRCPGNEDDIWLRPELDEFLRGPRPLRGLLPLLLVVPGPAVVVGGLPLVEGHVDHASPPLAAEMSDEEHVSDNADSPRV